MARLEDFLKLNKNRQIWTISKDHSVMQALILMSEKNIGAIIIVDNNDFPIGIFSERDYARKIILKGKGVKPARNNIPSQAEKAPSLEDN